MSKLEIGKGSIYTRYPNDGFRTGYDGIKWNSQQDNAAEWYGTRYERVEITEESERARLRNSTPGTPMTPEDMKALFNSPAGWIDRTAEYHAIDQMGNDADSTE